MSNVKKKKSSPDYPRLARVVLEASGDDAGCKLPPALYVVATPIGHMGDISLRALLTLAAVDAVACEDTRNSGHLMTAFGLKKELISCHDHNEAERAPQLIARIQKGEAIALISDAGLPLISDPGYRLVHACREQNIDVVVIPGANAALTALAGSGIATNAFHFAGFLPPKSVARHKALAQLKNIPATLIFYEAPQRLADMLDDVKQTFGTGRMVVVARELTKLHEETRTGTADALAAHYHAHPPKGEIVVLIAPPDEKETEVADDDIEGLLRDALRTQSLRDAVEAVSAATGRKKNEVYSRALWVAKHIPAK